MDSWVSLVAQLEKNPPVMQEIPVQFLGQEVLWKRDRLSTPVLLGFSGGSNGKKSPFNVRELGSVPGLGRPPGGGMATHSSILAWRIPWTEEPNGLQSMGSQESDKTE